MESDLYRGPSRDMVLVDDMTYLAGGTYDRAEILPTLLHFVIYSPKWDSICI